jgi:Aldolase/RraA
LISYSLLSLSSLSDVVPVVFLLSLFQGVIINGAIRDSAAIGALPLGVKALGTNPTRSAKADPGSGDFVVAFGGLVFTPGDWVRDDICASLGSTNLKYRLVAYIAHGRDLISFRLLALNDSPRLSFSLLNYIDQLQQGCLNDGTLEF